MENNMKKNILLVVTVILVGLGVAGGTYAWISNSLGVNNGVYNVGTHCFLIDYNINNTDNSQDITGTMFPTGTISGGLSGRVGLKTNSSCSVDGVGELKLYVNSATDSKLTTSATSYCENRKTLESISGISTEVACASAGGRWRGYSDSYCESKTTLERLPNYNSSNCASNNGTWKSGGSPLKYAVYDNASATGTPLSKGYITSGNIGGDVTIYDNIPITSTQQYYYIFIWLDGYLTDSTYSNLSFSGYISASAEQAH